MSNNTNNTNNTSVSNEVPEGLRIVVILLSVFIMIMGLFGNALVCILVYQNRKMRTAMNFFLVNLAISDGLICLFNIPVTLIYNEFKFWPFGKILCKTLPALSQVLLAAAAGSLVAVSWERFKWIVLTFNEKMSLNQAKMIIIIIWLIGLLNGLPVFGAMRLQFAGFSSCSEVYPAMIYKQVYTVVNFVLFYLLPVLFITPLYIMMIMKLRQKTDTSVQLSKVDLKRRKAALKMLLVVVVTYAFCVLPNHILFILLDFKHVNVTSSFMITLNITTLLLWANSMINPIIYCAQSGDYARGFIRIICCGSLRSRLMLRVRRTRGQSFGSCDQTTGVSQYERVRQGASSSNSSC